MSQQTNNETAAALNMEQLDQISGGARPVNGFLEGGEGNDTIKSTGATNVVLGQDGNDLLVKRENGLLIGGDGADV